MPTQPFRDDRPIVIGMVHLEPLPGSPRFNGSMDAVLEAARRDATALAEGGVDAIMIENYGDVPFYPGRVPAETVAGLTAGALAVRNVVGGLPIGVNVLRNDAMTAVGIAAVVGAAFVRVNVLTGARVTDQGVIEGRAAEVMRARRALCPRLAVWADVDVKHSAPLASRPLSEEVADLVHRGLADAVIVSGGGTGLRTAPDDVAAVATAAGGVPTVIGSGITVETIGDYPTAGGFIAGTALKHDGRVDSPVDPARVRSLVAAAGKAGEKAA